MLQLSTTLINQPVLSLRTGSPVATTLKPIINPNNLKIEGFHCQDSNDRKKQVVLLYQDIRDIIPQGFVINDYDVLSDSNELVRLQEVLALDFELLGKQVVTVSGEKLGKVSDYATEVTTMFVQKVYVSQSVFKNLMGGNLGIDRTQIVEITNKRIVVHDLTQQVPVRANAVA
jgi:uncharacterized protein YrrD